MPIQILDRPSSFGETFGRGLGAGLSSGVSRAVDFAIQMKMDKAKEEHRKKLLESVYGVPPKAPVSPLSGNIPKKTSEEFEQEFLGALPEIEQHLGRDLQPKEIDQLWEKAQSLQQQEYPSMEDVPETRQSSPTFSRSMQLELAGEHGLASLEKEREKMEAEREELPRKEFVKHAAKRTSGYLDEIKKVEDSLPTEDISLQMMEEATEDPSKWASVGEFLADSTGFEGFRTARGAELKTAVKQHFLGDLSSIKGGRPNILLEKNLLESYPMLGRDPIASQKFLAGAKMAQKIKHARVEITRELEDYYFRKTGSLPENFEAQVRKRLKPVALKAEEEASNQIKQLTRYQKDYRDIAGKQLKKGEVLMMSPQGEYMAIPKDEVGQAKEEGYIKLKE